MARNVHILAILTCALLQQLGLHNGQVVALNSDVSVIDLTHQIDDKTIYWPGNPDYVFTILYRGPVKGEYWYESNQFETAEHGGTHADAPAHFNFGSWRTETIPADRLVGPGVVVDVRNSVEANPDYRLGVSDLEAWEEKNGAIPNGSIVFMLSGWAARYPNKNKTFNTDDPNNTTTFHFPGFHPDAIDWLLSNRTISMIGVDTPSTDFGQSTEFEVHRKIAKANVIGLENVNNLDKLPPSGSTIFVGVIKLFDGSGGPARILALVNGTGKPACTCPKCPHPTKNSGVSLYHYLWGSLVLFLIAFCYLNNHRV